MECLNIYERARCHFLTHRTSLVSFHIYSGAPSSRFDIALEYDVNTDDTDDDHDSDDTEKMTNKRVDESEAEDEVIS